MPLLTEVDCFGFVGHNASISPDTHNMWIDELKVALVKHSLRVEKAPYLVIVFTHDLASNDFFVFMQANMPVVQ
jgi:hypothetical protein